MKKLRTAEKQHIREASREGVLQVLSRVAANLESGQWLDPGNVYSTAPAEYINKNLLRQQGAEASVPVPPLAASDLAEYLVASGPWHSMDGWSYLGRALHAHTQGDRPGSVHFAYYAELRAAMSLLVGEGIGILNRRHFILDKDGAPISFGSPTNSKWGTHEGTWKTLDYWATTPEAVDLLANVLTPFSVPVEDWFNGNYATKAQLAPSARSWLKALGLDLAAFPLDRNARNRASYHVSGLSGFDPVDADESLEFVVGAWRLVEPSPASPFEQLDRSLLRTTLRESHRTSYGATGAVSFDQYVTSAVDAAIGIGTPREAVLEYLKRDPPDDPMLPALARLQPDDPSAPPDLPVIARAALLLRIATGCWRNLFQEADITPELLGFSWIPFARQRGILDPESRLADCIDLWQEVSDALDDVETWRTSTGPGERTPYALVRRFDSPLAVLTRCERIGFWGLA